MSADLHGLAGDESRRSLRDDGYVVLRSFFEPAPLRAEVDHALQDAFATPHHHLGPTGNEFRYVPMTCARTPVSVALVPRCTAVAADLLGARVLPSRAKATAYRGDTRWHHDSDLPLTSLGFVAYLDPLTEASGALRVRRGSHRRDPLDPLDPLDERGPVIVLETSPGDIVVFDEHLSHASSGGGERRQWRVDVVVDEGDDDAVRAYYAAQHSPGWDGGYDAARYPSYGDAWRQLDARWDERLEALGAYAAARAEESFMRGLRRDPERPRTDG